MEGFLKFYEHTQTGNYMLFGLLLFVALLFYALASNGNYPGIFVFWAILALVFLNFRSLTVSVSYEAVMLSYGLGMIKKRFNAKDIVSAEQVRNKWWWGWGIRYIGEGFLYNVYGLDAVRIVLSNGKVARIGTDDPANLLNAVREAAGIKKEYD